jgi:hypothetical protein
MIRLIASKRLYRSGTGWCWWRWTHVDSAYITRLHVIKTPWFAICLHWLNQPDPEPWLHDHPVSFLSLVLRGGYYEVRRIASGGASRDISGWRNWVNIVRADRNDLHRITRTKPGTLTLVFMGPKTREWGFHTDAGWIEWKAYYQEQRKARGQA